MTQHEAEEYNHLLINEVIKEAETLGIEGKAGGEFIDRNILVIPDDPRKGMIFLGEESASYKLGNVRLNIKSAIMAALELVTSVNLPESFFNRHSSVYSKSYKAGNQTGRCLCIIFSTPTELLRTGNL